MNEMIAARNACCTEPELNVRKRIPAEINVRIFGSEEIQWWIEILHELHSLTLLTV